MGNNQDINSVQNPIDGNWRTSVNGMPAPPTAAHGAVTPRRRGWRRSPAKRRKPASKKKIEQTRRANVVSFFLLRPNISPNHVVRVSPGLVKEWSVQLPIPWYTGSETAIMESGVSVTLPSARGHCVTPPPAPANHRLRLAALLVGSCSLFMNPYLRPPSSPREVGSRLDVSKRRSQRDPQQHSFGSKKGLHRITHWWVRSERH